LQVMRNMRAPDALVPSPLSLVTRRPSLSRPLREVVLYQSWPQRIKASWYM